MNDDLDREDAAARAAIDLRLQLRALAVGQTAAFDLLHYQFGTNSGYASSIDRAASRLPFMAALLADVAWTNGDKGAHDGTVPPSAPEAVAVQQVFREHGNIRRRPAMEPDQRAAVVAYLDALLKVVAGCCELDEHAPSATLGREARRFVADLSKVREATVVC